MACDLAMKETENGYTLYMDLENTVIGKKAATESYTVYKPTSIKQQQ